MYEDKKEGYYAFNPLKTLLNPGGHIISHATAIELLQSAGLKAIAGKSTYSWGTWDHWKDLLTLRLLKECWASQFLICAEKGKLQEIAVPAEIVLAK